MHSADNAVARCPSVCHTPVFCLNGYIGAYILKVFFHHAYHSSFGHQTGWQYSDGDLPKNGGVKCKGDVKKITIFDQYLALSRK